jgi:hypothetical protein
MDSELHSKRAFCQIPEHNLTLLKRYDFVFCFFCGDRNFWHKRPNSLPTEKDEVILLNSSPCEEEEQAGELLEIIERTFPPSALSRSTSTAIVPIIKAEHS